MAGAGRRWWISNAVALAVFAGGVGVYVAHEPEPTGPRELEALPDLIDAPFAVTLDAPGSSQVPLGQPVSLSSTVGGATVDTLELWDGGVLVATATPEDRGGTQMEWPPLAAGPHLLTTRAISDDGEVATSAPLPMDVLTPAYPPLPTPVSPLPDGETAGELALRLQVDPADLYLLDPHGVASTLDPAAALTPTGAVDPAQRLVVQLDGDEVVPEVVVPSPGNPIPSLEVRDCAVELAVEAPDGARIGEATGGQPGFAVRGASKDGSFTTGRLAAGTHLFAVEADGVLSPPVAVTLPTDCTADDLWTGDASIVGGILTIPEPLDRFYLYLTVDDLPAIRIPSNDSSFLTAPSPRVDISALIPGREGDRLHLEVWQQVDASASLVAEGDATIPDGTSVADLIGEPTAMSLVVLDGNAPTDHLELTTDSPLQFRWTTASPRVTQVVWQVLAQPLSPGNTDLSTPLLLAGGISEAGPYGTQSSVDTKDVDLFIEAGRGGSFSFDSIDLPRPGTEELSGTPEEVEVATALEGFTIAPTVDLVLADQPAFAQPLTPAALADVPAAVGTDQDLPALGPAAIGQVYVRIIPIAGYQPLGDASALVTIGLPADSAENLRLDITTASVEVGNAPSPAFYNCMDVTVPWSGTDPAFNGSISGSFLWPVRSGPLPEGSAVSPGATAYDFAGKALASTYSALYPTSGVYCAGALATKDDSCGDWDLLCYASKGADAVVGAFGAVLSVLAPLWDVVSGAYNGLKSAVVELIAGAVCGAVSLASDAAGATCAEYGSIVVDVAISMVMIAYGIPPSLPTSGEIQVIAEGNLAAAAVLLMKQYGLPCDQMASAPEAGVAVDAITEETGLPDLTTESGDLDPCLALAEGAVHLVKTQVTQRVSTAVAQAVGMPYTPLPGFELRADPRATVQPVVITLEATLVAPDPAFFRTCAVTISPSGSTALFTGKGAQIRGSGFLGTGTFRSTVVLDERNAKLAVQDSDLRAGQQVQYVVHGPSGCVHKAGTPVAPGGEGQLVLSDRLDAPVNPDGSPDSG